MPNRFFRESRSCAVYCLRFMVLVISLAAAPQAEDVASVEPAAAAVVEGRAERGAESVESNSSLQGQNQVCSAGGSECQADETGAQTLDVGVDAVRPAPQSLNGKSLDPDNAQGKWWLGDVDGMTSSTVVAMDKSSVVLCYGRLDRGGCRFAKIDAKEPKLASGLLPQVAWEAEQLFHRAWIGRVEARRLDAGHMALCFERVEDRSIGCLVAGVNSTDSAKIVFGEILEVKSAPHLLSLVVTTTTRFSMCNRPADVAPDGGDCYGSIGTGAPCTTASCQLGEVDGLKLRWADIAPLITKV